MARNDLATDRGVSVVRPLLDPTTRQIRLVEVLPGAERDQIVCAFHVSSLDENPKYEALSYVWGDPGVTEEILVDGHAFQVTTNLASALRYIRPKADSRLLWIDAISINQVDNGEKTHQVNLMGDIYRNAHQGLMWLGDLPSLGLEAADLESAISIIEIFSMDGHLSDIPFFKDRTNPLYIKGFKAIFRLIESPWWRRMWTVQEIVLPTTSLMLCGPYSFPWSTMEKSSKASIQHSWNCCLHFGIPTEFSFAIRHMSSHMTGLYWIRDDPHSQQLLNLLWRFRARIASDPRDKVFALLGLLPYWSVDGKKRISSPDYCLNVVQVYSQVAIDIMRFETSLRQLVGRRCEEVLLADLPSWAMDWSYPTVEYVAQPWKHLFRYEWFKADAGVSMVLSTEGLEPGAIALDGQFIDTVAKVGETLTKPFDAAHVREVVTKWLHLAGMCCYLDNSLYLDPDNHSTDDSGPVHKITHTDMNLPHRTSTSNDPPSPSTSPTSTTSFSSGTSSSSCTSCFPEQESLLTAIFRTLAWDLIPEQQDPDRPVRRAEPGDRTGFEDFLSDDVERNVSVAAEVWFRRLYEFVSGQRFFVTGRGYVGIAAGAEVGDEVWVLFGGKVGFVVRGGEGDWKGKTESEREDGQWKRKREGGKQRWREGKRYTFVSDCYVHGIMYGEAVEGKESEGRTLILH